MTNISSNLTKVIINRAKGTNKCFLIKYNKRLRCLNRLPSCIRRHKQIIYKLCGLLCGQANTICCISYEF